MPFESCYNRLATRDENELFVISAVRHRSRMLPRLTTFNRIAVFAVCFGGAIANAETYPLSGVYVGRGPMDELEQHAGFAVERDERIEISKYHLKRMLYGSDGLASASIRGSWYYINRKWASLKVIFFDNGPDHFSEGLVRSLVNGKIAYFDKQFHEVIRPKYDWGFPFEGGRALVGLGCKPSPPDSEGHISMLGGSWGYIDRAGKEVVPVTFSLEEAEKRNQH